MPHGTCDSEHGAIRLGHQPIADARAAHTEHGSDQPRDADPVLNFSVFAALLACCLGPVALLELSSGQRRAGETYCSTLLALSSGVLEHLGASAPMGDVMLVLAAVLFVNALFSTAARRRREAAVFSD